MSTPTDQMQVNTPVDIGQVQQVPITTTKMGLDLSVAASGNVISNLIFSCGYKAFSFGCTSTQTGAINVQRYLDQAGTIKQGAVLTAALTANTPQVLNCVDGLPFQSFTVQVTNTGVASATISNVLLLLQAN